MERPQVYRINTVIDCAVGGADALARFYAQLLGWEYTHAAAGGWAAITGPDETVMAFQEVAEYAPPVWPWQQGKPGQMLHLDLWVADEELEAMVAYAVELGATEAQQQYFSSSCTLLDPAGHPFCIDTNRPEA